MRTTFPAVQMTIHLHGSESWHHKPLGAEIVHRAHQFGLAGASVFHGVEGFGSSGVMHTGHLMSISDELPIAIVIVDSREKIEAFSAAPEGSDRARDDHPGRGHGDQLRPAGRPPPPSVNPQVTALARQRSSSAGAPSPSPKPAASASQWRSCGRKASIDACPVISSA